MKTFFKTMFIMMATIIMSAPLVSCGDDKEDEPDVPTPPDSENLMVGYWYSEDEEMALYLKANGTGSLADIYEDEVDMMDVRWTDNRITSTEGSVNVYSVSETRLVLSEDGERIYFARITQKKWNSLISGASSSDKDKYEGEKWVGVWQGATIEAGEEFFIELKADGTYVDYIVRNGDKTHKLTTTYTVTGNTIKMNGECNFGNAWADNATMTFSGNNKMTWTNSLMDKWGDTLILTRQ